MQSQDGRDIPRYRYTPLKPGVFRLFRLIGESPLRAECVGSRFDDPICYDAVSYCWAGHERSLTPDERERRSQLNRRVLVSDGASDVGFLPVTASLETALLHLRAHTDKPLFVDQLCINQSDNAEKGRLVRRMGCIYQNADRVLAWLGPLTPEAERFVCFMKQLEATAPLAYHRLAHHDYQTLSTIRASVVAPRPESTPVPGHLVEDRDALRRIVVTTSEEVPLRGFVDICSRQFFGRMWIVQEACLPASLYFACGGSTWDVAQFERALLLVSFSLAHRAGSMTPDDVAKDYPKVDDLTFAIALCRFVNRLFSTRRTIHGADQRRMPLLHLLTKFNVVDTATSLTEGPDLQKFRAGNPRDCYYSLLALPAPDDTAVQRVVVDYDKPAQLVFIELAAAIMADHADVLLFSQNRSKQLDDLPSWVPDWSSQLALPHGYAQSDTPLFSAGAAEHSHWRDTSPPRVDGHTLILPGHLLDTIRRTGACVYDATDPNPEHTPPEVSQHHFLCEIEFFCRLAQEARTTTTTATTTTPSPTTTRTAPPLAEDAPWLLATGGRGLADGPGRSHRVTRAERRGPAVVHRQDARLLGAAYHVSRQYLARHTRKHELVGWSRRRAAVLRPLEARWGEVRRRVGDCSGMFLWRWCKVAWYYYCYWFGGMDEGDWEAYEFCEKFNRYWDEVGEGGGGAAAEEVQDGWDLDAEVREQAAEVSGLLGRAMDVQQGRRCFVTPGGYVGLGPRDMQAGDVVAILKGVSVPVVLRRQNGLDGREVFRYVSEACCYGVMDGEWQAGEAAVDVRII